MRDSYGTNDRFEAWKLGARINWDDRASWWHSFNDQISNAVRRGVVVRRARIVSEPVSEYIRWEHYATRGNIESGEQVRWLPRRLATDVALPGNDFWCFDDRLVRVHHFSGEGAVVEDELTDDPIVVKLCSSAFEAVWERAMPHAQYRI
jgi:hypothetical protein